MALNLTPRVAVYLCIQDGRFLDEDVHVYTILLLIVANIHIFWNLLHENSSIPDFAH